MRVPLEEEHILENAAIFFAALTGATSILALLVFSVRAWLVRTTSAVRNDSAPPKEVPALDVLVSLHDYAYNWFNVAKAPSAKFEPPKIRKQRWPHRGSHSRSGIPTNEEFTPDTSNTKSLGSGEKLPPDLKPLPKVSPRYLDLIESITPILPRKYLPTELIALQPQSHAPPAPLHLSALLNYPSAVAPVDIASPKQAELAIAECVALLSSTDGPSRTFGILRFLRLGCSRGVFTCAVHFVEAYCLVLVRSVHGELLANQPPALQELLVSVLGVFCWEHWHLSDILQTLAAARPPPGSRALDVLYRRYFEAWKVHPFKVSRATVMGVLCRGYLEMWTRLGPSHAKTAFPALFRVCASNCECHEHLVLLPILAEAVTAAKRPSALGFFYDILVQMVEPHIACCVEADDVLPDSILVALIMHGLEAKSMEARTSAHRLKLQIIANHGAWSRDVAPATTSTLEAVLAEQVGLAESLAHEECAPPGAWQVYGSHASFG